MTAAKNIYRDRRGISHGQHFAWPRVAIKHAHNGWHAAVQERNGIFADELAASASKVLPCEILNNPSAPPWTERKIPDVIGVAVDADDMYGGGPSWICDFACRNRRHRRLDCRASVFLVKVPCWKQEGGMTVSLENIHAHSSMAFPPFATSR